MNRVLFIHGTMTRYDAEYLRGFRIIHDRLRAWRDHMVVEKFPWGEYWGAEMNPRFISIPGSDERDRPDSPQWESTLVLGSSPGFAPPPPDPVVALWALLYTEPFAEIQLLAEATTPTPGLVQSESSMLLARALQHLASTDIHASLASLLDEGGIATTFSLALAQIIDRFDATNPHFLAGLYHIEAAQLADYRSALARAIVAVAMHMALAADDYPALFTKAALRDYTVTRVMQLLEGDAQILGGLRDWMTYLPTSLLTGMVLRPYRIELTKAILAFLGDILAYQAKRVPIQRAIAAQIADQPTILLAHSLGGIACVDMLLSDAALRSQVPLLITAGSQVGMLHEIGALGLLGVVGSDPTRLPDDFPPWLNLYDRNDMLGFRAAPIFAGTIRDVELDAGQPFPHAHGSYWENDVAWEHIQAAISDPAHVPFQLR